MQTTYKTQPRPLWSNACELGPDRAAYSVSITAPFDISGEILEPYSSYISVHVDFSNIY